VVLVEGVATRRRGGDGDGGHGYDDNDDDKGTPDKEAGGEATDRALAQRCRVRRAWSSLSLSRENSLSLSLLSVPCLSKRPRKRDDLTSGGGGGDDNDDDDDDSGGY